MLPDPFDQPPRTKSRCADDPFLDPFQVGSDMTDRKAARLGDCLCEEIEAHLASGGES